MESHWQSLSQDERQRALRYRHEADRARFVVARATLRGLLGATCGLSPQALVFGANSFGKPHMVPPYALHFNTSHSGSWVLHAVSASAQVGVDVEAVDDRWTELQNSDLVLAPAERDWLLSLDEAAQPAAFAAIWVRKEAYVKALGEGLSRPLRDICVIPSLAATAERLSERGHELPQEALSLCPIELGTGYAACLAYLGPTPVLRIRTYGDGVQAATLKV